MSSISTEKSRGIIMKRVSSEFAEWLTEQTKSMNDQLTVNGSKKRISEIDVTRLMVLQRPVFIIRITPRPKRSSSFLDSGIFNDLV